MSIIICPDLLTFPYYMIKNSEQIHKCGTYNRNYFEHNTYIYIHTMEP